ncbi:hypothetical protein K3495_g10116 [Podosphaera aphanis]|nr:hypothetical protein K3495_g10116 [Podosphaera aphanis]
MEHIARRLPTTAPPLTSFRDDKPCLLISWWCTLYSLVIIVFRAIGRYIRTEKVFLDDQIMLLAAVPLIARMIFETSVIYHGTNNVDITYLTGAQIKSRELGSKMVLVSRILYAIFSNAVVLFSLLQDKGYKKSKFKHVPELLDFKRPANPPRTSYRSYSVDESWTQGTGIVELNDVGGLLRDVAVAEDGTKNKNSPQNSGPQVALASHISDGYKNSCVSIQTSIRQNRRDSQDRRIRGDDGPKTAGSSTGDEGCWGRNNSTCIGVVDVLPPPPVRFGRCKSSTQP